MKFVSTAGTTRCTTNMLHVSNIISDTEDWANNINRVTTNIIPKQAQAKRSRAPEENLER
jgi:hypothetical protein